MAYDKIHGPSIVDQDVTRSGPSGWQMSGTDTAATVAANGYIVDGGLRGMRAGETLRYRQTGVTPPVVTTHEVVTVNANGSVDLSDGVVLSATNTA